MHVKLLIICALVCNSFLPGALGQDEHTEVMINLFATDLTGCDDLSACDTVVKIFCSTTVSDWRLCGETAEVKDDNFPVFPERFIFQYLQSEHMRWRFDLVDKDVIVDDPIGSVPVVVEEYLDATTALQPTKRYEIPGGRGSLFIHRRV